MRLSFYETVSEAQPSCFVDSLNHRSCYKYPGQMTWSDGNKTCQDAGAHLPIIETWDELDFLSYKILFLLHLFISSHYINKNCNYYTLLSVQYVIIIIPIFLAFLSP